MRVFSATKDNFSIHIQESRGDFERFLKDGYEIWQVSPEEKRVATMISDIEGYDFPDLTFYPSDNRLKREVESLQKQLKQLTAMEV